MRPYNEKVWATPLEEMSWSWIGERVSVPDPVRAIRDALVPSHDSQWGPNNTFVFPKQGGTGSFWTALGEALPDDRVVFGAEAVAIDLAAKVVTFSDGSSVGYNHLITTAPLDVTARMSGEQALLEATAGLKHNSVHVLGLGVDGVCRRGARHPQLDVLPRGQRAVLPRDQLQPLQPGASP